MMNGRVMWPWLVAAVAAVTLAALWLQKGTPGSFLPHGYCFTWNPLLLWTHVGSDALIGAAYVSIPITLLHLRRRRTDLPFNWIVVLFAIFILSCGATHWIEVWTIWNPDYWLSANVKFITAIASVLTAAALIHLVPSLLAIPTVEQLRTTKNALELEVISRRQAEEALLHERADLERRVHERTEELVLAKAAAEAARSAADEANRVKDRFLAKVSHELRTPLQATLSWAEALQTGALNTEQMTHAAARITNNIRTQSRLLDDLLDISRILSGKLIVEFQRVDVVDIVRKAVEVVRAGHEFEKRHIELQFSDSALWLWTDPLRLEQVVWNLLKNAVNATASDGRISVQCHASDATWALTIQDNGKGIEVPELATIFEPFWQSTRNNRAKEGLGLGLAISKSITQLLGGELSVSSAGLGQGASFTLRLPIAQPVKQTTFGEEQSLSEAEQQRLTGLRILHVEDNVDIAAGVEHALEELGVEVETCNDFDTALLHIREGGFDLLLADLNLGNGHTAFELLAALRLLPHASQVPAVVLSAYGGAEEYKTTKAAGFAAHLVKPLSAQQLARAIVKALPV